MSKHLALAADRWTDVTRAVSNKQIKPIQFERIYIGKVSESAPNPVYLRKISKERKISYNQLQFALHDPLTGVGLTRRETQVLYLICQGLTNREAAERIGLSARTAEYYIRNMRKKTLAVSKSHLIQLTLRTDFLRRIDHSVLSDEIEAQC